MIKIQTARAFGGIYALPKLHGRKRSDGRFCAQAGRGKVGPASRLGGVGGLPALTDIPATAQTVSLSVRG